MANKKTVVFDFDGVIHSYISGWKGIEIIPDEPVSGIRETIAELRNAGYYVAVVTTRATEMKGIEAVWAYLKKYDIKVDSVQSMKPPAICYVDDRGLKFDGNTKGLVEKIKNFHSWTEKKEK